MGYIELFQHSCSALAAAGVSVTTKEKTTWVEYRMDTAHEGRALVASGDHLGRINFWTSLDRRVQGLISAHHTLYHHLGV